ncbi:hypothetical protein LTR56_028193, partial [Elasticomyces elasticus]
LERKLRRLFVSSCTKKFSNDKMKEKIKAEKELESEMELDLKTPAVTRKRKRGCSIGEAAPTRADSCTAGSPGTTSISSGLPRLKQVVLAKRGRV